MKTLPYIFILIRLQSCTSKPKKSIETVSEEIAGIKCDEHGCIGKYEGAEFINGVDVAHQFSNKMSAAVGNKLKEQYQQQHYKKVNLSSITMTTKGMGSGRVVYTLSIPFTAVDDPCDAYTSFDHSGGWNHKPDLERRKNELKDVTLPGQQLDISALKTTAEGLQEYWIQWKNKSIQAGCN